MIPEEKLFKAEPSEKGKKVKYSWANKENRYKCNFTFANVNVLEKNVSLDKSR